MHMLIQSPPKQKRAERKMSPPRRCEGLGPQIPTMSEQGAGVDFVPGAWSTPEGTAGSGRASPAPSPLTPPSEALWGTGLARGEAGRGPGWVPAETPQRRSR